MKHAIYLAPLFCLAACGGQPEREAGGLTVHEAAELDKAAERLDNAQEALPKRSIPGAQ